MADDDDTLDVAAQVGREQQPSGAQGLPADPRPRGGLRDERPVGGLGEQARGRPRVVAGHDDRPRTQGQHLAVARDRHRRLDAPSGPVPARTLRRGGVVVGFGCGFVSEVPRGGVVVGFGSGFASEVRRGGVGEVGRGQEGGRGGVVPGALPPRVGVGVRWEQVAVEPGR